MVANFCLATYYFVIMGCCKLFEPVGSVLFFAYVTFSVHEILSSFWRTENIRSLSHSTNGHLFPTVDSRIVETMYYMYFYTIEFVLEVSYSARPLNKMSGGGGGRGWERKCNRSSRLRLDSLNLCCLKID